MKGEATRGAEKQQEGKRGPEDVLVLAVSSVADFAALPGGDRGRTALSSEVMLRTGGAKREKRVKE